METEPCWMKWDAGAWALRVITKSYFWPRLSVSVSAHHVTKQPRTPKATALSYYLYRAKGNSSVFSCFLSRVL